MAKVKNNNVTQQELGLDVVVEEVNALEGNIVVQASDDNSKEEDFRIDHTNLLDTFTSYLLDLGFVEVDTFAKTYLVSLLTGIPVIYYGRGGYGKTEMIKASFDFVQDATVGVLECDVETTAAQLKGGAIARTTRLDNEEHTEAFYKVQASMLNKDFFFLEEVLDAMYSALSVCKSIITSGELHINGELIRSRNKHLVCATNQDPRDLLASVPEKDRNSYEAFLQRFLVIPHGWEYHDAGAYRSLLHAQQTSLSPQKLEEKYALLPMSRLLEIRQEVNTIKVSEELENVMASLAEASAAVDSPISPRVFMWTCKVVKAYAYIRGNNKEATLDSRSGILEVLKFMGGWEPTILDDAAAVVMKQQKIAESKTLLRSIRVALDKSSKYIEDISSSDFADKLLNNRGLHKEFLEKRKECKNLIISLDSGSYPDELMSEYNSLKYDISQQVTNFDLLTAKLLGDA